MQTRNCDMLLLIAIEIQTAKKDIASTVNELMETTADEDKTVDLSLLDGHEANPFVEKTESDMMREIDAMLEKLCCTCFKLHLHASFHFQSTFLD